MRATSSTLSRLTVLPVNSRYRVTGRFTGCATPTCGGRRRLVFVFLVAGRQSRQQENAKSSLAVCEKVRHVRPPATQRITAEY